MGLHEVNEAARLVHEVVSPEANIIFGATIDDTLGDEIRITVVAAGFDPANQRPIQRKPFATGPEVASGTISSVFDLPIAAAAETTGSFSFNSEAASPATQQIAVIEESEEVIAFPRRNNSEGFGDDLDIPDFLK
jgi:cell division protein FtsZ